MKRILLHSLAGNNGRLFDPAARDGISDPAIYLRDRLHAMGYQLETFDGQAVTDYAWILFFDVSSVVPYQSLSGLVRWFRDRILKGQQVRNVYRECQRAGLNDRCALFLWEPPSTLPANYDPRLHRRFSYIFTWNDTLVNGRKFHKIYYAQPRQFPAIPCVPFQDRKLLVNISANKYSRHQRELYTARRAAIRYFEQVRPNDFDLYGLGWAHPAGWLTHAHPSSWHHYASYRGAVRHKWEIFPRYRFSICYENIRDEPGYITEKIFDSMRAGCVPIYRGASNITDYVDTGAFIDRRQFGSEQEVDRYISSMTELEYSRFQEAMRDYLASARFTRFLPATYAQIIITTLNL